MHVPQLLSRTRFNDARDVPKAIVAQTSHIDLLPTLLKLAYASDEQIDRARRNLSKTHAAAALPGANLLPVIEAGGGPVMGPDGRERTGVLFATDDMITEPLPCDDDPHNIQSWQQYEVFAATVERLRTPPADGAAPHPYVPDQASDIAECQWGTKKRRGAGPVFRCR